MNLHSKYENREKKLKGDKNREGTKFNVFKKFINIQLGDIK